MGKLALWIWITGAAIGAVYCAYTDRDVLAIMLTLNVALFSPHESD